MKRKQVNKSSQSSVLFKQILLDIVIVFIGGLHLYFVGSSLYWSYVDFALFGPQSHLIWLAPFIVAVVAGIIVQWKVKEFWRSIFIATCVSIILGAIVSFVLFNIGIGVVPNIKEYFTEPLNQSLFTLVMDHLIRFTIFSFLFAYFYCLELFAINYIAARIRHSLVGSRLQK